MKKKVDMLIFSIFCIIILIPLVALAYLSNVVTEKQNETIAVSLNMNPAPPKKKPELNHIESVEIEEHQSRSIQNMIKQSTNTNIVNPVFSFKVEPVEGFIKYDIDLPEEMQMHAFKLSEEYDVDIEVVYAIMWHESRFIVDVKDNINTNGSRDRGLMQINEVNWNWLSEVGLDVNDPYDNIESGVYMLSDLMEKYDTTRALMAYQCGEGRMKQLAKSGHVTNFVYEIMDIKENVIKI